jgi:hypothetical protein
MTPNRIVAVLTPLVFAPLSGAVAAWISGRVPGIEVSEGELTGIFVAGALFALAPALQWLHGWQKFEAREAEIQRAVEVAHAAGVAPSVAIVETADEYDESYVDEYHETYADGDDGDLFDESDDEYDESYGDEYDESYGDEYDESYGDEYSDLEEFEEPAPAGS